MNAVSSIQDTPRVVALAITFAAIMLVRFVTTGAVDRFDPVERYVRASASAPT